MRSTVWSAVVASTLTAASLAGAPAVAACVHPYFPMVKGETHVYRASGIDVTEVVTGLEGEVVTLAVTTGAGAQSRTTTVTQTCTAEGLGSQSARSADGKTSQRTIRHAGTEYGPAAQMKVGGGWSYQDVTESVHGGMTVTSAGAQRAPGTGPQQYRTTAWIAKGVGLLKLETRSGSGEASVASELVGFTR